MENDYPSYIDSKPIGEDQFEGKSQERIAKSIAKHIEKNETLKVIGIEGEWGSGKSNIVEIIRTELAKPYHLYIYDAWGHQEDSHRRAFLEELTEDLIKEEVLDNQTPYKDLSGKIENITWQKKIKLLLSRKRETNKKTIPKLSIGIIIIGIVLILTPILTLVSDILFDKNSEWWEKISLPLLPIVLAIMAYLVSSAWNKKWGNISELFFIFKGKEIENTTYEIFSDLEPSVKEFKEWIQSISDGLKKGLVIVYDNMDRLPPEKVKGLWSSIHTFFAEHKYDKMHIIIPFDRKHLQQAFSDEEVKTNEFINKTFSITYRVSPPVLTDWKDFFSTKFEEAFGTDKEDLSIVLSIFDRLKDKFTPRDIIVFINELVTYNSIWKDEIPLKYIAVFVIKKETILENPQKVILENNFLDAAKNLFIEDGELQNFISALAFNVPIEKASQVLLVRDLELILRNSGQLAINELAKHPHFIEILEVVIFNSDIVIGKSIPILSELDTSKINGRGIKYRITKIWDELSAKHCANEIKKLSLDNNSKSLLKNSSKGSQKKLVKYLTKQYKEFKDFSGEKYFHCLKTLDLFISKESITIKLGDYISENKVSPEIFIDYLNSAKSEFKKYKLTVDIEEFDIYLSEKIQNEIDLIPSSVNFSILKDDFTFNNTKETIETLITEDALTIENFHQIIDIYKSISKEKILDKLISINNLYQLLQSVDEEIDGYYDLIAIRLKYASSYNQFIAARGWVGNTAQIIQSTDEYVVNEISKQIEFYENYGGLLILSTNWNQPLLSSVCKDLSINSYGTSRMSITTVLPEFENIVSSIDIPEQDLLNRLNSWHDKAIKNININNLEEIIPNYSFYEHSTTYTLKLTTHINKIAKEYINSIDEDLLIEEWNNDESYGYNTLYFLMDSNKVKSLPRNVFNALKQVLKKISESEIVIPEEDTIWSFFLNKTMKNDIAPTVRGIRDYFMINNNITVEQFYFFEGFLEKFGKLIDKQGDVTRTILGKVISNDKCFDLVVSNQNFYVPIINGANEDAADFKDNIYQRLENDSENEELISFAKKIGIELKSEEVDTEE